MAAVKVSEHIGEIGVLDWFAAIVRLKVLFRHIGDIAVVIGAGEQVIERLILDGAPGFRDGKVPVLII